MKIEVWSMVWILLLVLNYARHGDAGSVYRYDSRISSAQDGGTVQASLDPGFASSSQGLLQIGGLDPSVTGIGTSLQQASAQPVQSSSPFNQQGDLVQTDLDIQNGVITAEEIGSSGSQAYSYTSGFKPSSSSQPVQSAYWQVVSAQPVQSSSPSSSVSQNVGFDSSAPGMGSSGSSADVYNFRFKPSTSTSKPVRSSSYQVASGLPVLTASQQVSLAQPLLGSSQFGLYSQDAGLGSSTTGTSGSSAHSSWAYASGYKPSASTSKPAQSTSVQQAVVQPVQSAFQQGTSAQPVQSSSPSSFVSNVGLDSSSAVGAGSRASFYPSSFRPSTSTSRPVQSTYQQVASAVPAQSSYQLGLDSQNVGLDSGTVGTSGSIAYSSQEYSYTSGYRPAQSTSVQQTVAQPVQTTYQQVASAQPVQSSSPSSFVSQAVGLDSSAMGPSRSGAYSYTSGFKPSTSTRPVQSTYQQMALSQPQTGSLSDVQSGMTRMGSSDSRAYSSQQVFSTPSYKPSSSTLQQVATSQPVQATYQQTLSAQPLQSSYQSGLNSQDASLDTVGTSTVGTSGSSVYGYQTYYTSGYKPTTITAEPGATGVGPSGSSAPIYSSPRPSTSTSRPVQTTYQQVTSALPAQSSSQSGLYSQGAGFGSSAVGTSGSRLYDSLTYTSGYKPTSVTSEPAETGAGSSGSVYSSSLRPSTSTYQQVALPVPAQSSSQSGLYSQNMGLGSSAVGTSGSIAYSSQEYSYTSGYRPAQSMSVQQASAQPAQSSFQQVASAQPAQSSFQQVASAQPAQSSFQQVASAQPAQSSSPSSFVSQAVGLDSSAMGASGSRAYFYTSGFKPSISTRPVQSTYQQMALSQPLQTGSPSSMTGMGSSDSRAFSSQQTSSTPSYKPSTSTFQQVASSQPVQATYQQALLAQPLQSSYQSGLFPQDASLDSSTVGPSGSSMYSSRVYYTSGYKPAAITSEPGATGMGSSGSSPSVYSSSFRPYISTRPAQGSFQQAASAQPAQGSFQQAASAQPAQGSFQQAASAQPAQGSFQQAASAQPAQGSFQQAASAQPAQGSSQSGLYSQDASFGSSAVGTSGSLTYASGYKPTSVTSKPAETGVGSSASVYSSSLRPSTSTYQQVALPVPAQSSSQSGLYSQNMGLGSSAVQTSGSRVYSSQEYSYTSGYRPAQSMSVQQALAQPAQSSFQQLASAQPAQSSFQQLASAQPAQSSFQQLASAQPVQSSSSRFVSQNVGFDPSAAGGTGSRVSYTSSFKPSTSTSKPAQSSYQLVASSQPVQSTYQQASSAQPLQSSYQSGLYSQDAGLDSSAGTGTSGSGTPFYTASFKPSTSISKPVSSTYQQVTSSQPAQSSSPSGVYPQNVGFDPSVTGMGSGGSMAYSAWGSSYTSSYKPSADVSRPVQSSSQQVISAQPVQSSNQAVPDFQSSYGIGPSGVTASGSSNYAQATVDKPVQSSYSDSQNVYQSTQSGQPVQISYSSDWVALPAQGVAPRPDLAQASPSSYAQAASSQDNSEPDFASSGRALDQPKAPLYSKPWPSLPKPLTGSAMGASGSGAYSYTSGFKPSTSTRPVQSTYQQMALSQPAQTRYPSSLQSSMTGMGSSDSQAYGSQQTSFSQSYSPSSTFQQVSTGQPVQATYQQTSRPLQSSYQSSLYSQDAGFGSSTTGTSVSTGYKPAQSASVQQVLAQPAQSTYQQVAVAQPVQSSSPSSFVSQGVGFDSSATGSRVSFYPSSFKPSTSTFKPAQSTYQQVASGQPVQSTYQQMASAVPAQSSYQLGLIAQDVGLDSSTVGTSGLSTYGSETVYTPGYKPTITSKPSSTAYSSSGSSASVYSSFSPSTSTSKPVQSTYPSVASGQPFQATYQQGSPQPLQSSYQAGLDSSAVGSSGSRLYYTSGYKPAQSTSVQQALAQPVQTPYQQVAAAQPVQSSSPSSFVSQAGGLDSSATGASDSGAYSYTASFKPSTTKPVQSTYQQTASIQPLQTISPSSFQSSVTGMGSSDSRAYSFQQTSYTPSYKPVQSANQQVASSQPFQATYQQVASAQPVQSSSQSSFASQAVDFDSSAAVGTGSRISFYPSSFKPSTSTSKPVQSTGQQVGSGQSVQATYQQASSAQPLQSSYQSGLYSQDAGLDSSTGTSGLGTSFYTSSFKPSTSISKPVSSTYQQVTSSQPAQSSSPSGVYPQNVGFDPSVTGMGSGGSMAYSAWGSSYTSSYKPSADVSRPVQSSSQQVISARPVQSSNQAVPDSQSSYGASQSGLTAASGSAYTSSCKPSTGGSKPDQSTYVQKRNNHMDTKDVAVADDCSSMIA
ncbi:hypothetical protein NFI96_010156 [Prochilodus magdalenae]|nr:hypothetical protein NFI96_010156 [Prochilodus magdalenae]